MNLWKQFELTLRRRLISSDASIVTELFKAEMTSSLIKKSFSTATKKNSFLQDLPTEVDGWWRHKNVRCQPRISWITWNNSPFNILRFDGDEFDGTSHISSASRKWKWKNARESQRRGSFSFSYIKSLCRIIFNHWMSLGCCFYVDFRLLLPLIHFTSLPSIEWHQTTEVAWMFMRESLPANRFFVSAQSTLKSLSALWAL